MTPELILFDLDGTLFDHPRALRSGIVAHVTALGAPYRADNADAADDAEADALVTAWQTAEDRHYRRYLDGELDFPGQRIERAREFTAGFGVTGLTDAQLLAWFEGYSRAYQADWAAYDDAAAAFDRLADAVPGIRFGIITNGELSPQVHKLARIGLADRVDHVIASGEFGVAKPDPRIFAHAVERYGVDPDHAVYVGDRLTVDALGAARAGLTGVWLDRDERGWGACEADAVAAGIHRITSLHDLPRALGLA